MLSPIDLEYRIQSAEYYFATLMDQVVDESMQLEPVDESFVSRVDNLFYVVEAIRFLYDRGIYTDNETCLAVYQDMMDQIGINCTLPDVYVDTTLIIPGLVLPTPFQGPQGSTGPQGPQGPQGAGPQGNQGPQGPQGVQGAGTQGPQGNQGPIGSQGPQGFQGANGTSVVIKGSVATVGNLPSSGNTPGDLYIVLASGDGYVWNGSSWDNVGQIQGPQGFQGPQGQVGSQGAQGFQGPQGAQGAQGNQGFQGPQGNQGPQGTLFTGTTNTLSKFGGSNTLVNSNITDNGSVITAGVNTNINGAINIGNAAGAFTNSVNVAKTLTGSINPTGVYQLGVVQSDASGTVSGFKNEIRTAASSFNLTNYYHYVADFGAQGAGSTISNQIAFLATNGIAFAANNYGFYGDIPPGGGRWNLYMAGGAPNYVAGNLNIGTTSGTEKLTVQGNASISGSTTANSFVKSGGTSSQFLKANGSVDSNTYLTSTGTAGYVPRFTTSSNLGDTNIQIAIDETVGMMVGIGGSPNSAPTPRRLYVSGDSFFNGNIYANNSINTTAGVVADSFIKSGGSSSQFLKANGSVDSTSYTPTSRTLTINGTSQDLSANRSWTINETQWLNSGSDIYYSAGKVFVNKSTDDSVGANFQVAGNISFTNSFNTRISNYTLVLTDQCRIIQTDNASANTVTIPAESSVNFPVGTEIAIIQEGAGQTEIVAAAGVTIKSNNSYTKIAARYTGATLVKMGSNQWYLIGNLA